MNDQAAHDLLDEDYSIDDLDPSTILHMNNRKSKRSDSLEGFAIVDLIIIRNL
jgi:hypothetical protein